MQENQEGAIETAILSPLVERSKSFLQNDLEIDVLSGEIEITSPKSVELKKNTAMIGTSGTIQVLITIGYDDMLLDKLVEAFLEGEEADEDEMEEIYESVSSEFINTVVGNALQNPLDGSTLNITPPVLIYEAKSLFKQKGSKIAIAKIKTQYGEMLLTTIGPKESFSKKINFKEL